MLSLGNLLKRSGQLYDKLLNQPVVELTVLVGPSGGGASNSRGEALWTMTCSVVAWRSGQQPVDRRDLTLRRRDERAAVDAYLRQFAAYTIHRIQVRLLDEPGQSPSALLEAILQSHAGDAELTSIARQLQKLVVYEDSELGAFTLDRRLGWYAGKVPWGRGVVEVNLSVDDNGEISDPLEVARDLWKNQAVWTEKVCRFAAVQLLDVLNDNWLSSDEAALSADEFANRVSIESFVVQASGECEFYLHDGGLFVGHSIVVSRSATGQLDHANLAG